MTSSLLDLVPDVNFFALGPGEVGDCRPAWCPFCRNPAGLPGNLGLHGHGTRRRVIWAPEFFGMGTEVFVGKVRRYKCTACKATCTVRPRGVGVHLRYASSVVMVALYLWATLLHGSRKVRDELALPREYGLCNNSRWRRLPIWASSLHRRVGLEVDVRGLPPRSAGHRVLAMVLGRGPPVADPLRDLANS